MSDFRERLIATLRSCQESRELLAVHLWVDELEAFIVGYVKQFDQRQFMLEEVDSDGHEDGNLVSSLDEVARFHVGSPYLRILKAVHEQGPGFYRRVEAPQEFGHGNLYKDALGQAMKDGLVTSLKDSSREKMTGFITEVGDDYCVIEEISESGEPDGLYTVRLDDLRTVSVFGRFEQMRAFAYRHRLGLPRE